MIKLKALLLLPGLLCATPEWSVWRGPASEGNYDHETTWKHDWLPIGPKTLWQTKVHIGYSIIAARAQSEGYRELARHSGLGKRTWSPLSFIKAASTSAMPMAPQLVSTCDSDEA